MENLCCSSTWSYRIKKIWFDHCAGTATGVYHFNAITIREKQSCPTTNPNRHARQFYFSFAPDKNRDDIHVKLIGKTPPEEMLIMLKAFIELLLDNPSDWIEGAKAKRYVYYPNVGTFYIREMPCLVLPEYVPLFELSREAFAEEVTLDHPFIQSINIKRQSA